MMKEFDKIIGYAAVKTELEQISDTLKNREVYARLGVTSPKGLLLYGEPGVGKTLMAESVIEASGRKTFICRKNQPNGDFVNTIKDTFANAAAAAPSIVFLADMDKFANSDEHHRDAEEYVTVQSCIDDMKGSEVFVLATANSLRNLPRSLMRAGRFDRVIEIEAPRGNDAVRIIKHYLSGKSFISDIDADFIGRVMDGRSCAELETVINEAGLYAGFERRDAITMDHFLEACVRMFYGVSPVCNEFDDDDDEDWYSQLSNGNSIKSQIVYHEAGHAIISELLCPQSVTLVSAHNQEGKTGGFTSCYRSGKETPLFWQQSRIVVGLGGMAAVEQKFGIADCGTERDLDQTFNMVRDLVVNNCVCGFGLHEGCFRNSEDLRARQEQAVAAEVERYYRKAKEIVAANGDFLEMVAAALAKKGILITSDIQSIKAKCALVPVNL